MSLEDLSAEALADIEANVFVSVHMDSPEKDAKLAKKYLTKYNVEVQPSWSDQETVHRAIALRHQKTAGSTASGALPQSLHSLHCKPATHGSLFAGSCCCSTCAGDSFCKHCYRTFSTSAEHLNNIRQVV